MTLKEIVDKLGASVGLGSDKLDREEEFCFASDLMSDVLTLKDTPVLITGLCNVQTIRTCDGHGGAGRRERHDSHLHPLFDVQDLRHFVRRRHETFILKRLWVIGYGLWTLTQV